MQEDKTETSVFYQTLIILFGDFFMDQNAIMKIVLSLAARGRNKVSPNPMVGAVLVRDNEIIAQGYHHRFGEAHAEIDLIRQCDETQTQGADLYVNLEPCSHQGKTPPCTEAIVAAGIKRVFCGITDPNPLVQGRGLKYLRKHGLIVKSGILEAECQRLNETFIKYITTSKPFVTLKTAQTLDGCISTLNGHSRWITNESSRNKVHELRAGHDAVLVGINTLIADDCRLTVRNSTGYNPARIIVDARLRFPENAAIASLPDPEKTIIITSPTADAQKRKRLSEQGLTLWNLLPETNGYFSLPKLLKLIGDKQIASLLVEGGSKIFSSFLQTGECDRLITFIAPKIFGSGKTVFNLPEIDDPDQALVFKEQKWLQSEGDIMFEGRF